MRTDLLQRVGNTLRGAGELHSAGVGQVFALAADRGLNELPKERTAIADYQQAKSKGDKAAAFSRAAEHRAAHQGAADDAQNQNAVEQRDNAQVDAHITVENMAELVGHYALKLLSVEQIDGALVDANHCVMNAKARGESINTVFTNEIYRRHRHTSRNGHFLYHIKQLALLRVTRVLVDQHAAKRFRHRLAATA